MQHIGETARIPIGDGSCEPQQLGPEHGLGRHHLSQRGERPGVVGLGEPLNEKPVDQPTALTPPAPHIASPGAEAHPDPHPRLSGLVQLLGHRVVEVPVEMQHTLVDEHAPDGPLLGKRGPPPRPRLRLRLPGLAHALTNQRKLLGRRTLRATLTPPIRAAHSNIPTRPH